MYSGFEQGPIRPPSEASSLLLRFTRNCPWNKCAFCPVYKRDKFSRRSLEEIKQDIDNVSRMLNEISSGQESINRQKVSSILGSARYGDQYKQLAFWLYQGDGSVFIQDANSMIMKTKDLVQALKYLKAKVPGIKRITMYARSSTIVRKSLEELQEIRDAGLNRLHVGLESGSDQVLELVRKGCTAKQHIEAGQKVVQSGIALSEYIMPGLGGRELSREHALETARVLNAINPQFIRLRTLQVIPGTELDQMLQQSRFELLTDDELVQEIRLFISELGDIQSTLTSDHILNLLEEVQGSLPRDKEYMLGVIDEYLSLPEKDRLLYRLGRRGGALRSVRDIQDPDNRARLENAKQELESREGKSLEEILPELGRRSL
ncbi:MAG: radical SAM protein [Desulfohalobiaceae bacterium]